MTVYVIVCCEGDEIVRLGVGKKGQRVRVTPADAAHMTIAVNPVVDGQPTWPPGEFHKMTTAGAAERRVTEISWPTHRSWIVRCNSCSQQVQISALNLPALGERLRNWDDWPAIDGVRIVPLGVLSRLVSHLNG